MKDWAEVITKHLSRFIEILAAVVIGFALIKFLVKFSRHLLNPNDSITNQLNRYNLLQLPLYRCLRRTKESSVCKLTGNRSVLRYSFNQHNSL